MVLHASKKVPLSGSYVNTMMKQEHRVYCKALVFKASAARSTHILLLCHHQTGRWGGSIVCSVSLKKRGFWVVLWCMDMVMAVLNRCQADITHSHSKITAADVTLKTLWNSQQVFKQPNWKTGADNWVHLISNENLFVFISAFSTESGIGWNSGSSGSQAFLWKFSCVKWSL